MEINYLSVLMAISAALVSGMGTALVAGFRDNKKEKVRRVEREQDHLKLELKDLYIKNFKADGFYIHNDLQKKIKLKTEKYKPIEKKKW